MRQYCMVAARTDNYKRRPLPHNGALSCLFIEGWTCLFIHQWKMFTVGETRPNCDANEPQEDAQGTGQIRRGRLNNETPEERERRLQIQREQQRIEQGDIRKPQSKDNIAWLSKDSAVRRKQPIPSLQISCAPSPSFARFCESRISSIRVYSRCLRIGWNTLSSVWYGFSTHQEFL